MSDILMIVGLGAVAYLYWALYNKKPLIPFMKKRKKKSNTDGRAAGEAKEISIPFKELIDVKNICGNLVELEPEGDVRTFVGAVRTEPINYALRSLMEQQDTDNNYERLLSSLSLGPGREVHIAVHVQSRPIELVDQLKQYHETFPQLDVIAQRYAQSMFFPFMEQWQNNVDEYNYSRYIFVPLEYAPKLIENLDEELIIAKAQNEFVRLANTIVSNYGRMGGVAKVCSIEDLLEAMYFATHKQTGTVEGFRSIFSKPGRLMNFVLSDYSRDAVRHLDEEEEEAEVMKSNEKVS